MTRELGPVLVTGAAGMVGRPVALRLRAAGHRVVATDLNPAVASLGGGDGEDVVADIRDTHVFYDLMRRHGIATVIHAGGISGPMLLRDRPFQVFEINVIGTLGLAEAARVMGVGRFVFCSSAAAFGNTPPAPVPDDAPLRPKDTYGASKGAADCILAGYRAQSGLDAVSLRLSNVYGPGRATRCAVRTMVQDALAGRPTRFDWGAGEARPYCYIDDAVDAIIAAAGAAAIGRPAYNVAGPGFVPMEAVADAVRRAVPGADIAFRPGLDGLGYRREALDLTALSAELGFAPAVGIGEGVARYAAWMRASG